MPDQLVHLIFDSTSHHDAGSRIEGWRKAMSVSADIEYRPEDIHGFSASVRVSALGDTMLCDIQATSHDAVRSPSTLRSWAHDHIIFDFFPMGGFEGNIAGKAVSVDAGDCVMFDLKGTMRIRFGPMRCLALVMPRKLFDAASGGQLAVDGLVFRKGSVEANVIGPMMEHALAHVSDMPEPVAAAFGFGLIQVIASCAARTRPSNRKTQKHVRVTLRSIERFIDRNAGDRNFGMEAICSHFELSRTTLYRFFEGSGGIADAIRRSRVELAVQLLTEVNGRRRSISDVAHACGFANSRSLRRALLAVKGLSPKTIKASSISVQTNSADARKISALFDEL